MAESGLRICWIYATNLAVHISGNAISQAVRRHLIFDAALNTLVLVQTFSMPVHGCPNTDNKEAEKVPELHQHSTDLDEAGVLHEKLMQGLVSADQVFYSDAITSWCCSSSNKVSVKFTRMSILKSTNIFKQAPKRKA